VSRWTWLPTRDRFELKTRSPSRILRFWSDRGSYPGRSSVLGLAVQKRASGKFPKGSGSTNRCSYWNKPDPFSVVATMNGPNLDYAGSWARNSPNLAVALSMTTTA